MSDLEYKSNKKTCKCPKHLSPHSPSLRCSTLGPTSSSMVVLVDFWCQAMSIGHFCSIKSDKVLSTLKHPSNFHSILSNSFIFLSSSISAKRISEEVDTPTLKSQGLPDVIGFFFFFNHWKNGHLAPFVFYSFNVLKNVPASLNS